MLAEAATRVGPSASYYAITAGGAPIGYSTSTLDTTPAGIVAQTNMVLDIQALGSAQKTGITTVMNLTRTLHLRSFEAQLNSDVAKYKVTGTVSGDTALDVTIEAGGSPQHQHFPLSQPIVMSDLVNLRLAVGGELKVGRSYALRMFDPLTLQQRDITMNVLAESTMVYADSARYDSTGAKWVPARIDTTKAFKVSQTMAGMTVESWINGRGDVLYSTTPLGFTVQRTAFEIAVENWKHARARGETAVIGAGSDVITTTAITANVQLHPAELNQLTVRLGNVSLAGFDLSGGRQRLSGDTLTITREHGFGSADRGTLPALFNAHLPFTQLGDSGINAMTRPEPLIQSDDPAIVQQARRIVGDERGAGAVTDLLTRWVYTTLEKKITISVPSAVQVLQSKSGDCNEHTVLFVALARSLGLPARTAVGVVYLRGHFYYHAWPEVWLGEWVAVDPTFGQYPADASHLRFVVGGLARQVELVRLIGKLQVDVVRAE